MKISEMAAGVVFKFESTKNKANSGFYFKTNSKNNRCVNLHNFKNYIFSEEDEAEVKSAEIVFHEDRK